MTEPRTISPEEARTWLADELTDGQAEMMWETEDFAHTVATEPDRIRAATVEALRQFGDSLHATGHPLEADAAYGKADAIENGADL